MRSLLKTAVVCGVTLFALGSCMDDDSSESKATCNYMGKCDTLSFTMEEDTAFRELILESFDGLGLTGGASLFTEKATVNYGSSLYAIAQCNTQAIATYKKKLSVPTLDQVKSTIYEKHRDSLNQVGYGRPEALPIHSFRARFQLYNLSGGLLDIQDKSF